GIAMAFNRRARIELREWQRRRIDSERGSPACADRAPSLPVAQRAVGDRAEVARPAVHALGAGAGASTSAGAAGAGTRSAGGQGVAGGDALLDVGRAAARRAGAALAVTLRRAERADIRYARRQAWR